jgi:hypothetical protein
VGVFEGVVVNVDVIEGVTVNVEVKVGVGVLDGVTVEVDVLEGVTVKVGVFDGVIVGVGVFDGVGVNVTTAHNGAESDKPDGLIVFTVSSYNLTYFTCGICLSEALNGSNKLYELPRVVQLPDK